LSKPQLGLNNDEWKSLCSEITCIYHSGAWVNGLFDYRALKAANVGGTIEILRLAVQDKIKSLHYVSTISVIKDRDAAKEEPLDVKSLPWGTVCAVCVLAL
jgi:thioester reductase-like protein